MTRVSIPHTNTLVCQHAVTLVHVNTVTLLREHAKSITRIDTMLTTDAHGDLVALSARHITLHLCLEPIRPSGWSFRPFVVYLSLSCVICAQPLK